MFFSFRRFLERQLRVPWSRKPQPTRPRKAAARLVAEPLEDRCLLSATSGIFATAPDAGGPPLVKVYDAATGTETLSFLAYDANVTGGVRVAIGDVNGDGTPDIITAPGPGGGPHIHAF